MTRRFRYFIPIFAILGLLLGVLKTPNSSAQENVGLTLAISAGHDGFAKHNAWSPVDILAINTGPDVAGEIRLQTSYPGETYAQALNLPSQSRKMITLFLPLTGDFTASFISDDGQTLYKQAVSARMISPESLLLGVIASDPSLLNFLAGFQSVTGDAVSVAHLDLTALAEVPQGLSAFNVLIFNDIDTSPLSDKQRANLTDWVTAGGHLILGGGPNANATTSGLTPLLPTTDLRPLTIDALTALEAFANEPIPPQGPYLATVPQSSLGEILIDQAGHMLLTTRLVGQGKVTYFALDFGLAPMNGWAGNTAFWETLLDPIQGQQPFYAHYETSNSLNNALANINVAGLPSPTALLVFLCTYIIILVPLNYFVLKWVKRRELAWITIPALIILFTLAGYIGGFRARGGRALLRQIAIVQQPDAQIAAQLGARATVDTFIGLYSPDRGRFTLTFQDGSLVKPTDNENIKSSSSTPTTTYYGAQTELRNLWTDVGTMATAIAHGQTEVQPIDLDISLAREGNTQWRISGTITNHSDQILTDAALIAGDYGVKLDQLALGQTQINHTLRRLGSTNNFNNQTIWGDYYPQVNDPTIVANDRIIRSIFWSNPSFSLPRQNTSVSTFPSSITLYGWQDQDQLTLSTIADLKNQRADKETMSLLIIHDNF